MGNIFKQDQMAYDKELKSWSYSLQLKYTQQQKKRENLLLSNWLQI